MNRGVAWSVTLGTQHAEPLPVTAELDATAGSAAGWRSRGSAATQRDRGSGSGAGVQEPTAGTCSTPLRSRRQLCR